MADVAIAEAMDSETEDAPPVRLIKLEAESGRDGVLLLLRCWIAADEAAPPPAPVNMSRMSVTF